jgi:hypothetical protein
MASTYINDLRLNEMATGDGSGTWGTTTNTNLELIAEAFSYGTEVITTNADTHTTTIADGATDPGRSLYLKYTGTLDSACTITIGPNTVSKVWIIENGTSGSQDIILSCGSGANITIPAGDTKVVYSDGAGAGAAFFDAFASLSVVDLKVQDDLTVTGVLTGASLDISGDIDIDGTANLDIVDIDGAVNMATTALVTGVLTTTATQVATGGITSGSDIISDTDSTDSLGSTGVRWLKGWFDTLTAGTLTVGSGSVTDSSGAISFGDENLTTTGIVTAAGTSVFTNLDISGDIDVDGTTNLDVVDIDGAVDMASTALVTGVLTANGGAVFNEAGADVDFRVESDTVDHALFVQGSDGNVGIGNSVPLGKLTISNAAGANAPSTVTAANTYLQLGSDDYGPSNNGKFMIGFGFTDATNTNSPAYIGYEEGTTSGDTYGDLTFYTRSVTTDTAPTERMRIDSDGNVKLITANDTAGTFKFLTFGTNSFNRAGIKCTNAATYDGSLEFYTGNASNFAERMRIDSSGNVGIGTSSPAAKLEVYVGSSSVADADGLNLTGSGENGSNLNFKNAFGTMVQIKGTKEGAGGLADEGLIEIRTAVNGTLTGGVKIAAGSTSWSSISDERLKDIIEPITNAAEKVSTLRAVIGNYKTDPKKTRRPFLIAQDIQAVLPEAVDDTNENELSLRYTETIPLLVAAIQEQQAIIESLTTRLETLENA